MNISFNLLNMKGDRGSTMVGDPYSGSMPLLDGDNGGNVSGNSSYDHYEYEYEYDPSLSAIPLEELLPVSLVYGITLIIGVIGNALVIASILKNRRMQSVTNIFLTSLATADLTLVLLCVPIKFAKFMAFSWTFGEALCKLVHYMQNVSVICSILTMTAMSMERYYAIVHPMKAKFLCTVGRARTICVIVWCCSFVLASPIIIGQVHKPVGWKIPAFWCVKAWDRLLYSQLYETGMLLLIFIVPLIIVSFAYTSICTELYRMSTIRNNMRSTRGCDKTYKANNGYNAGKKTPLTSSRLVAKTPTDDSKTRRQVIKMLVTIICLFTICWGPTLIDNTISAYSPETLHPYNYGYLKYMRQAFSLMAYFNSCVNPIVYAFMSKNFREGFKRTIFACCGRTEVRNVRRTSFSTRTSTISVTRIVSKYEMDGDAYETKIGLQRKLLTHSCNKKGSGIECETGV